MSKRIKNLSADILKCGKKRIRFDPTKLTEISRITTREEVRKLIAKKIIFSKDIHGISRGRARYVKEQKNKGRRKGPASKTGTRKAFEKRNKVYVNRIRTVRDELRKALLDNVIDREEFRYHYTRCSHSGYETRRRVRLRIRKTKEAIKK